MSNNLPKAAILRFPEHIVSIGAKQECSCSNNPVVVTDYKILEKTHVNLVIFWKFLIHMGFIHILNLETLALGGNISYVS